jgi:acyl carrier protein
MNLNQLIGKVLRVKPEALNDESSPATLKSWDSFNHIQLMVALEEAFDVKFSTLEMDGMKSVSQIRQVLVQKGITL